MGTPKQHPMIGVIPATDPADARVSLVPPHVAVLKKWGCEVGITAGAGLKAGWNDEAYREAGARVYSDGEQLLSRSDIVLTLDGPPETLLEHWRADQIVIGLLASSIAVPSLLQARVTCFALEFLPRITRAQSMDVLSSQACAAGYQAVLVAAERSPRFFPMLTTAAGTIRPAKVLVIGAGVAGLQAIATAKRLGAQVEGYDVRAAAREQVESLGAKFVGMGVDASAEGGYARALTADEQAAQEALLARHVSQADAVITTASVPGKRAPVIIRRAHLCTMRPGSIVIDLAAPSGGNTEGTVLGETVWLDAVQVYGPRNLPAQVAFHASEMWSKNMLHFLQLLCGEGVLHWDKTDPILVACARTNEGK